MAIINYDVHLLGNVKTMMVVWTEFEAGQVGTLYQLTPALWSQTLYETLRVSRCSQAKHPCPHRIDICHWTKKQHHDSVVITKVEDRAYLVNFMKLIAAIVASCRYPDRPGSAAIDIVRIVFVLVIWHGWHGISSAL